MSDINRIRQVEDEQTELVAAENRRARERISRAEADAAFRAQSTHKECVTVIADLVTRGRQEAAKEIAFLRDQNRQENRQVIAADAVNTEKAVAFILKKIL
ncbi:MAG: hypothetical protein ABIF71_06625 [Planctomycetota bacterium]